MSTLLAHVWQSTAVLAATGLLALLLRSNSARVRHALWTAASLKFLLPFAALSALGGYASRLLPEPLAAPPMLESVHGAAQAMSLDGYFASPAAPSHRLPLTAVIWAVWAIGFLAVCGFWLARWWKLRAILRAARGSDLAAPVRVMLSAALLEPGLVGIVRPVLLLPEGITEILSAAELQSVLAHEACHLRRRDNLTAALHMVVEAVFWFWPPVWWLGTRLIVERERACDEAVVAAGSDPEVYAETILKVCKFQLSPLACAAGVSGGDLKQRMEEIMRNTVIARVNIPKKALLASCVAVAVALPLLLGLLTFQARAEADAPHAGTEAALRRHIEGWENKRPATADMDAELIKATEEHRAAIQKGFDELGALESITFYGNDHGNDVYRVQFEHALTVWTIGPLKDGKISTLFLQPATRGDDKGPSPGLADSIRRELEGNVAGKQAQHAGTEASLRRYIESLERGQPNYEEMTPGMADVVRHQLPEILAMIRRWGALEYIVFKGGGPDGMDVYEVIFAHGRAEWLIAPLDADGKVVRRGFAPIP